MGLKAQDETDKPIKVFISYSTDNKKAAGKLKQGLEQLGFDCFLAHEDLPAGEWRDNIDESLHTCDVFLPMLTDEAKESAWVHQESGIAHSRKKKGQKISIVPLKAEYDPPGCISIYQAHQLRSGFWGGLKFESQDILVTFPHFLIQI